MKNSSKKNKGFTLLEIVISLTLGAMLIGVSYTMLITSMKMNKKSGERQSASYYGQQILEKFKSADVPMNLTGDKSTGYKINLGDIVLEKNPTSNSYSGQYDLNNLNNVHNLNGYVADITIIRNESGIGAGQKQAISNTANTYTLKISGSGKDAEISIDKKNNEAEEESKPEKLEVKKDNLLNYFEVIVDVEKDSNFKKVCVNGKYKREFFNEDSIRFNLDFSSYDFNFEGEKEISNPQFRIIIKNHDDKDLNLCIQKSNLLETRVYVENDSGEIEDADIVVNTQRGGCKVYNNRLSSETTSNIGNLYDIYVTINKDGKEVFNGSASQNLKIYDGTQSND